MIEIGAGRGNMALCILEYIEKIYPELYAAVSYSILDFPGMIKKQLPVLNRFHAEGKVVWREGSALSLPFEGVHGVIWFNELIDAFPVEVVSLVEGEVVQKYVGFVDGKFVEYWGLPSREVLAHINQFSIPLEERKEEPINLLAESFLRQLAVVLERGLVVNIDYGSDRDRVGGESAIRTFSNGFKGPGHVREAYLRPGEVDLTANVNFGLMHKLAKQLGFDSLVMPQAGFFNSINVYKIMANMELPNETRAALRHALRGGDHFRVQILRKGVDRLGLVGGKEHKVMLDPTGRVKNIRLIRFAQNSNKDAILADMEERGVKTVVSESGTDGFLQTYLSFQLVEGVLSIELRGLFDAIILTEESFEILHDFTDPSALRNILLLSDVPDEVDVRALLAGEPYL
ncbi:MAG: SAM-dependent methyltransferase [bacterium]|nr:SAM-dependent methyltransferase [bacterium]